MGICGKDPDTAALQDLIVYVVKGISQYAHRARQLGATLPELDRKTLEALFVTLTNVNFDADEHVSYLGELAESLEQAKTFYEETCRKAGQVIETVTGPAQAKPTYERLALMRFAYSLNIKERPGGDDLVGMQELVTYAVKGLAAYAHHALVLGYSDQSIFAFVHEALDYISAYLNTLSGPERSIYARRSCSIKLTLKRSDIQSLLPQE
jgi:hydroxylamine reductase